MDDLREKTLLNGLKLMTEDGQPVTSYQCGEFGLAIVEQMGEDVGDSVQAGLSYRNDGGPRRFILIAKKAFLSWKRMVVSMKRAK